MGKHTILPNFWGRQFGNIEKIDIGEDRLSFSEKDVPENKIIDFSNMYVMPTRRRSLFGHKINFLYDSERIRFSFLSRRNADTLFEEIETNSFHNISSLIEEVKELLISRTEKEYLRDSSVDEINRGIEKAIAVYKTNKRFFDKKKDDPLTQTLHALMRIFPVEKYKDELRNIYEQQTLSERAEFFNSIESNPLTEQQQLAVIRNNDINLILAAAGTGKTAVMVAKALDLIDTKKAQPGEILLLAYNASAAAELKSRVKQRAEKNNLDIGKGPRIETFHALGRHILKACERPVRLSPLAENEESLEHFLGSWIRDYLRKNRGNIFRFLDFFYTPRDVLYFATREQYEEYILNVEFMTLQGERVKGYQELLIANWLFMHGIPYKYEAPYIVKRRLEVGLDYKPDFHLTDTNIYIEHFGIDREGHTRADIDSEEYNQNIIRKRETHQKYGTTLLETYHYDWTEHTLYKKLQSFMNQHHIPIRKKSEEEMFAVLNKSNILEKSRKRYSTCLKAIRTNQLERKDISECLKSAGIPFSEEFTEFLSSICEAYKKNLNDTQTIDFDDMILTATELIEHGYYKPKWTYILVDEFQDISEGRMNLLRAICRKSESPVLTVVGDDWQSIYRFSGGKLELTTRFGQAVGSHTLSKLEKTFRYNDSIAETAGTFIMKNPEQYEKYIEAHEHVSESKVYLYDTYRGEVNDGPYKAIGIYENIRKKDTDGSVYVLARYNYLLRQALEVLHDNKHIAKDPNLKLLTFHKSKGLEADYCILIGLSQGKLGFPNRDRENDVIEALLPKSDIFKDSEERRLFYVALTRAKKECHIVADSDAPSVFVEELLSTEYDIQVKTKRFTKEHRNIFKCPQCSGGYLKLIRNAKQDFYACSSFFCFQKARKCHVCEMPSIDGREVSTCQNPDCGYRMPICKECGRPMAFRDGDNGRYRAFWGCSGYGAKGDRCENTKDASEYEVADLDALRRKYVEKRKAMKKKELIDARKSLPDDEFCSLFEESLKAGYVSFNDLSPSSVKTYNEWKKRK